MRLLWNESLVHAFLLIGCSHWSENFSGLDWLVAAGMRFLGTSLVVGDIPDKPQQACRSEAYIQRQRIRSCIVGRPRFYYTMY